MCGLLSTKIDTKTKKVCQTDQPSLEWSLVPNNLFEHLKWPGILHRFPTAGSIVWFPEQKFYSERTQY